MAALRIMVCFVTVCGLLVPRSYGDNTKEEFGKSLVGEWRIESSNLAGKQTDDIPATVRIHVTSKRMVLMNGGKIELELDCRTDATKSPNTIDVSFDLDKGTGPVKMSMKGIYRVRKDGIDVCLSGKPRGQRPLDFLPPNKENALILLKLVRDVPATNN